MAFRLATIGQNAACNAFVALVDAGSTNTTGRILFYTGSQPATPQTTASGTLLATISFNNPSFGSSSNGSSSMTTGTQVQGSVSTSGTPGWFRITDRNNNAVCDGSVTASGGGGDMTFDSVTWVSSGNVAINSITITFPM